MSKALAKNAETLQEEISVIVAPPSSII